MWLPSGWNFGGTYYMTIQFDADDLPGNGESHWGAQVWGAAIRQGYLEAWHVENAPESAKRNKTWRLKNKEKLKAYADANRDKRNARRRAAAKLKREAK